MENLDKEFIHYIIYCEKSKKLSPYTLKAYKIDLEQYRIFCGKFSVDKIILTNYIQFLLESYKPKTVRRKIASLKAFFRYLYCQDIIENNPFEKINTSFKEPKALPKTIPPYIIQSILCKLYLNIDSSATPYQKQINIRNAAIIELLFATGARISEICHLRTNDIDLKSRTIKIFGKGSKERIIQIENKEVISILNRYINAYDDHISNDNYFFLNNRLQRLSEQSVRYIIYNLEKQISSPIHITPHMFRHSVATLLLEEDVDIRYIQKILGHSSITTTQIYTHVTSSKQREILRTKHPRNKMNVQYWDLV